MSSPSAAEPVDGRVAAVRRFNRFFTQRIGVLHEGLLDSRFSLAEVRVMYELAHRERPTASELCEILGIDAGYMSRIVTRLAAEKIVSKRKSETDARAQRLSLTRKGSRIFAELNQRSQDQITALLDVLTSEQQDRLVGAMRTVEEVLGPGPEPATPYVLRSHRTGDMGWVVWRHGVVYASEYGWNEHFEALVAEIVVDFIKRFDPRRDRCWIAERDGRNIGSVFLVRDTDEVAKLRLLLVEPEARGLGVGRHLVTECVRTARELGYRKLTLWTNDVLHSARRIYQSAGFRLLREEAHHSFGHDLVGQYWELDLAEDVPAANRHYLLFYDVVPEFAARREPLREAHLEHARRAYQRGELVLAGPLERPTDGAVLVFRGQSPSVAEAFAARDPYVQEGLVTAWRVCAWAAVIGAHATGTTIDAASR